MSKNDKPQSMADAFAENMSIPCPNCGEPIMMTSSCSANDDDPSELSSAPSAGEEYAWKEAAKDVVRAKLRDPESAEFTSMKVYPETDDRATIICGYVNSRNGFGGMTGPQRFIAGGTVMLEEEFTAAQMTIAWTKFCY